ncbi:MAG: hypothetical protein HN337_00470, partial [Deltaproteobacteria bacterium]|nr:hypothetical protein [Deltaproteobacteria bacterium]
MFCGGNVGVMANPFLAGGGNYFGQASLGASTTFNAFANGASVQTGVQPSVADTSSSFGGFGAFGHGSTVTFPAMMQPVAPTGSVLMHEVGSATRTFRQRLSAGAASAKARLIGWKNSVVLKAADVSVVLAGHEDKLAIGLAVLASQLGAATSASSTYGMSSAMVAAGVVPPVGGGGNKGIELPSVSRRADGIIEVKMPKGVKVGTKVRVNKIENPNKHGLLLLFTSYVIEILEGNVDKFTTNLTQVDGYKSLEIKQDGDDVITQSLRSLIMHYGALQGLGRSDQGKTVGQIREDVAALIREIEGVEAQAAAPVGSDAAQGALDSMQVIAGQFAKLEGEIRGLDAALKEKEARVASLTEELEAAKGDAAQHLEALAVAEGELKSVSVEIEALGADLAEIEDQIAAKDARIKTLEGEEEFAAESIRDMQGILRRKEAESAEKIKAMEGRLSAAEEGVRRLKRAVAQVTGEAADTLQAALGDGPIGQLISGILNMFGPDTKAGRNATNAQTLLEGVIESLRVADVTTLVLPTTSVEEGQAGSDDTEGSAGAAFPEVDSGAAIDAGAIATDVAPAAEGLEAAPAPVVAEPADEVVADEVEAAPVVEEAAAAADEIAAPVEEVVAPVEEAAAAADEIAAPVEEV